jgi:hypothetical protein
MIPLGLSSNMIVIIFPVAEELDRTPDGSIGGSESPQYPIISLGPLLLPRIQLHRAIILV